MDLYTSYISLDLAHSTSISISPSLSEIDPTSSSLIFFNVTEPDVLLGTQFLGRSSRSSLRFRENVIRLSAKSYQNTKPIHYTRAIYNSGYIIKQIAFKTYAAVVPTLSIKLSTIRYNLSTRLSIRGSGANRIYVSNDWHHRIDIPPRVLSYLSTASFKYRSSTI